MYEAFLMYAGLYRLVVIAVGFGTIFFGYRLFVVLTAGRKIQRSVAPNETDSEFELEGKGVRISLRSAAPGTFFALFGVVLISIMVATSPPELRNETATDLTEQIVRESTVLRTGEMSDFQSFMNRYDDGLYDNDPAAGLGRLVELVRERL